MNNKIKEFNFYMLIMLLKQSYEWSHTIGKNDVKYELKFALNNFINSGKKFLDVIEKEFDKQGEDINEIFWEESEIISKFFEFIKNENIDKKNELIEILRSYMKGTLTISYDEKSENIIK